MSKEIIIRSQSTDIDIALLENSQLVEFTTQKLDTPVFAVGSIYVAKVKKVIPGLNAVFVDLGYEKDAFLHYHDLGPQFSTLQDVLQSSQLKKHIPHFDKIKLLPDIPKDGNIADVISVGQYIMVQVAKEPISTKGPRLCSEISIAGRNIVLMPFSNKVSISQKIEDNEEKMRLKKVLRSVVPQNYGVIVRTAAQGFSVEELEIEVLTLIAKWEKILQKIKKLKSGGPHLLMSEMNIVSALLRDIFNPDFNNIITNDREVCDDIKEYIQSIAPTKLPIVKYYNAGPPIFEQFGVEKQIKSLFSTTVPIKNGAYLIIEKTEALHVIDVNSGNRTKADKDQETNAFDVNTIAAKEIARQIRLRDLGGIIIIDFIDLKSNEHKIALYETMKLAMASDRARHNILPLTKFGLMQITRQRVKPEQLTKSNDICPTCNGTGEIMPSINIIQKIEDDVVYVTKTVRKSNVTLLVHPIIYGYLTKGLISLFFKWRFKYSSSLKIEIRSNYNYLQYELVDEKGQQIKI